MATISGSTSLPATDTRIITPSLGLFLLGVALVLVWARSVHYLLFHTLAELIAVAISFSIFTLTWASRQHLKNGYLVILGAAYVTIGFVDIFHTLTFKGMNLLPGVTTNYPTQFWLTARFIEAVALVIAPLFVQRLPRFALATWAFAIPGALGWIAVMNGMLPATHIEGVGLTQFKIVGEYVIILILLTAQVLLWRRRQEFAPQVFGLLSGSLLLAVATEFCFVHYVGFYDFVNELGHFFRFLSVILAYLALVVTGIKRPTEILYRQLVKKDEEIQLANEQLTESEYNLNKAQAVAGVGSWHLDIPGNKLSWSDETYRLFGVPRGTPQTFETFASHIHPDDLPQVFAAWDDAVHKHALYDIEHRIVVHGNILWVRERAEFARDADGVAIAGTGTVQNITQSKSATERLKTLLETASDGIHILDEDGNLVQFSLSFARMLGYTAEEAAGLNVLDWDVQIPREQLIPRVRSLIEEPAAFETRHRRKDGSIIDVEINAKGVVLDGLSYLYASSRDITERKQLVQRVVLNEERMNLALAGADLGLWDLDIQSGGFSNNPRLVAMLGYQPGEVEVNVNTFLSTIHPDDLPEFSSAYFAHLKAETPIFEAEYRLRHKGGHWVWILSRGKAVERDANARALRMTGTNLDISERKHSEAALKAREARLSTLITSMQDIVIVLDAAGTVVEYFHPPLAHRPSYMRREDMLGKTYGQILPVDVASSVNEAIAGVMADRQPRTFEYSLTIDGKKYLSQATMSPLLGESEFSSGFLMVVRDITTERNAQREFERLARSNALLLESVGEGIFGVDLDYRSTFVNSAALAMLGFAEAEIIGQDQHSLFHHHRQDGSPYLEEKCPIKLTIEDGQIRHEENEWFWRKDGSGFPVTMTIAPVVENDRRMGAVVIFQDVTERKASEEKIRDLAFYDPLTRLPNRRLLLDRLSLALPAGDRRNSYGAVLFLDLDNFKILNDAKGHEFGDLLLIEVARRLLSCVRIKDTVARLGGDEFVVMLEDLSPDAQQAAAQAAAIGEKIRVALGMAYSLKEHRHHGSASIGVCLFKGSEAGCGEIIKRADMAMYQAKSAGRNTIRFFKPSTQ